MSVMSLKKNSLHSIDNKFKQLIISVMHVMNVMSFKDRVYKKTEVAYVYATRQIYILYMWLKNSLHALHALPVNIINYLYYVLLITYSLHVMSFK
jgi:hypothetical protein